MADMGWLVLAALLAGCQARADSLPRYRLAGPYATGAHPNTLIVADLDGDGDHDIAVPALLDATITALRNDGNGTFTAVVSEPWSEGALDALATDIDGDGRLEVALSTFDHGRLVLVTPAEDLVFGLHSVLEIGGQLGYLAAADLVGGPGVDLAMTRGQDDELAIWAGDGQGAFSPAQAVSVPDKPTELAVSDVDGDGALEIAVVSSIANQLSVLTRGASGSYGVAASAPVSEWPASVASSDLDGDGIAELVGTTNLGDTLFMATWQGARGALVVREQAAGAGSFGVAVADLDGDGQPDAVATSKFGDTVSVFRNDGGELVPAAIYAVGRGPTPVEIAELDGDGRPDIVVVNGFSNDVSLLLSRE